VFAAASAWVSEKLIKAPKGNQPGRKNIRTMLQTEADARSFDSRSSRKLNSHSLRMTTHMAGIFIFVKPPSFYRLSRLAV